MNGNDIRGEQELSELARLLPVPAARDLLAGRRHDLKEHLMTELRQMEPKNRPVASDHRPNRPYRLAAFAGAGVLAVAVAATAFVAGHGVFGHGSSSPQADTGTPAAAVLLARIANAAASQPAPTVRNSDFMYIRSEVAYTGDTIANGHETSILEKLHERQVWLPVANICVTGLLEEEGSSTPLSPFPVVNGKVQYPSAGHSSQSAAPVSNVTCPSEGHLGDATYRLLQSFPTSSNALLNYLRAGKKWTNDNPATEIGDLIGEAIIPPAVAAELYRVAALLPGAVVVPNVTNAVGQHGIGISWAGSGAGADDRTEWVFDKTTLQYIGERDYNVKTGVVSGESAVLQRAFVNKPGQLP